MAKKNKSSKGKNKEKSLSKIYERKWNVKKHLLVVIQALLGGLVGLCFFSYHINSKLYVKSSQFDNDYTPSFYEISEDYYESENYSENLLYAVDDVIRYVAIRQQMEVKGEFVTEKAIDVGKFANRNSGLTYEGPSIEYYLGDLINWGQKALSNSELFCSYDFYTAKEYCDFFSLDYEQYILENEIEDENMIVASFETLKNQYRTIEGKGLEEYVDNVDDYLTLTSIVQQAATDLYSNYIEYLNYRVYFQEDNTNIRYVVVSGENLLSRNIFTNDSKISKSSSDNKINDVFKKYGEYVYASPGNLSFSTNTPVLYEDIGGVIQDKYSYAYTDDSKIWISIDTSYPVEDVFYLNSVAFSKTARILPWIISLGASAFVVFIVIGVYTISKEKKMYSLANTRENLSDFDKMPIEIGALFFILLILALMFGESIILKTIDLTKNDNVTIYMIIATALVVIDIFVSLLFLYAFARRIICKNVWDGSIASALSPEKFEITHRIKSWFDKVFDSSGVAVKTWTAYILFLLFNVFWGSMLMFGSIPIISLIVLLVFDITIGFVLFNRAWERKQILDGIKDISAGDYEFKIDTEKMRGGNKELGNAVNEIGVGLGKAVEISIKDEKLKADLITNVSHDIKTPLTSIINYVDLLKRENIEDERVKKYISVLDEKSQRLKQLTFDLVEASKITSGNIQIDLVKVDFKEFIKQALGEFEEKYSEKGLVPVLNLPKNSVFIMADPRHMWRVLENLLSNIYKYAEPNSRVYIDMLSLEKENRMVLALKNISGSQLNISADELTERFIRGDVSRSTEGSGLGLSIAKSLTIAQKGLFDIYLDGDLFKVTIEFDIVE